MKRNAILITIVGLFSVGLILGVLYLNNPDFFGNTEAEETLNKYQSTFIQYKVLSGEITHTYDVAGKVVSDAPDLYITYVNINQISDSNFEILKKKGDVVAAKEPLYKFKGTEKSVDYNAKIIDIQYVITNGVRSVNIKLLNYDKLYIVSYVDADKISKITYETKVDVFIDGKSYNSKITDIGYEIIDKMVPICVDLPQNILPGAEVKLTFTLDIQKAGMYVLEDAIYKDGDTYYADIQTNDGITQTKVTVGQRFFVEEDGFTFKYVELLSGVSVDDIIIVEKMDELGSKIKENLSNE